MADVCVCRECRIMPVYRNGLCRWHWLMIYKRWAVFAWRSSLEVIDEGLRRADSIAQDEDEEDAGRRYEELVEMREQVERRARYGRKQEA